MKLPAVIDATTICEIDPIQIGPFTFHAIKQENDKLFALVLSIGGRDDVLGSRRETVLRYPATADALRVSIAATVAGYMGEWQRELDMFLQGYCG